MKKKLLIIILCTLIVLNITNCNNDLEDDKKVDDENTINIDGVSDVKEEPLKNEKEILDISSEEYYEKIGEIFETITSANEIYKFQGFTSRYPYLQISIYPTGKYDKAVIEQEAKEIINKVLQELKKYKFKTGGLFSSNYEFLNIYFYDYDKYGNVSRNGGPFAQINVLEIENVNVDNCFW